MEARQPTVLVVDDEAALRLLCKVNLELEGFRVVEAGTLADARAVLEGGSVDVVLLDVHVGPDDGRALLDELRGHDGSPGVALFSGTADLESLRRERVRIIRKPFTLEDLTATVRDLVPAAR